MVPCENERCPLSRRTGSNQLNVPKEADLKASAGKGMVSEIGKEVSCATAREEARREVGRREARRRMQKVGSLNRWIATGPGWDLRIKKHQCGAILVSTHDHTTITQKANMNVVNNRS